MFVFLVSIAGWRHLAMAAATCKKAAVTAPYCREVVNPPEADAGRVSINQPWVLTLSYHANDCHSMGFERPVTTGFRLCSVTCPSRSVPPGLARPPRPTHTAFLIRDHLRSHVAHCPLHTSESARAYLACSARLFSVSAPQLLCADSRLNLDIRSGPPGEFVESV